MASGAYLYGRRSLPQMSGTIHVEGLSGPVEIVRDADAIPHIFASAKQDAFFESRSGSRSASAGAATPPWPVSSGPPPVQSGVYRGATRSIDNQQH